MSTTVNDTTLLPGPSVSELIHQCEDIPNDTGCSTRFRSIIAIPPPAQNGFHAYGTVIIDPALHFIACRGIGATPEEAVSELIREMVKVIGKGKNEQD